MTPLAGFKVSYSCSAFKTRAEPAGVRPAGLDWRIESAAKKVTLKSRFKWIIVFKNKAAIRSGTVELFVIVPGGADQDDELLLALVQFEEAFEQTPLALPVDRSLRTIIDDDVRDIEEN